MKRVLIVVLLSGVLLTACQGRAPVVQTAQPAPQETQTPPPGAAPPPSATETPPPAPTSAPPAVLLAAPQGCSPLYEAFCQALEERAAAQGWQIQQVKAPPAALSPGIQAVVLLPGLDSPGELARQAPQVPILALGYTDLPALPNLSVLDSAGASLEKQAFLAGYIAALHTDDWRVGMLLPAASGEATLLQRAFQQGVTYFCGLCRPAYPPFHTYPVFAAYTAGDSPQAAVQALSEQSVQTAYLPASLSLDEQLLQAAAQTGLQWITAWPAPPGLQRLASVYPDPSAALDALWPALTGGEAVHTPMPLGLDAPGLSPGRLRLAQDAAADLMEDNILVQVDSP